MRVGLVGIVLWIGLTGCVFANHAKEAMSALNQVYWDTSGQYFRVNEKTDSGRLDFWMTAHVWECVMDAYEWGSDTTYRKQIGQVYDGFVKAHPDWITNPFNDDIMWWTIACARAYRLTQDERYLKKAQSEFDRVYSKEVDTTLGGGMWWKDNPHGSKNACVNGPAAITAMELSFILKDESYAKKARDLYRWERDKLFDPDTGAVYDNLNTRGRVSRWLFTYNQGTFIGAALRLYRGTQDQQYLEDATLAGEFMRQKLCNKEGILKSEGQRDGGTFKIIGVRYMVELAHATKNQVLFDWLQKNADTVWTNRRVSDNIMGYDWSKPVKEEDSIECQSAAGGVVLLNLLK